MRRRTAQLRVDNETQAGNGFLRGGDPMTWTRSSRRRKCRSQREARCRLLEVSRSAYYERKKRRPLGPRARRRRADRADQAIHAESGHLGLAADPRGAASPRRGLWAASAGARLMRRTGLKAVPRRWRRPRPGSRRRGGRTDRAPLRALHRARPALCGRHHLFGPALGYVQSGVLHERMGWLER